MINLSSKLLLNPNKVHIPIRKINNVPSVNIKKNVTDVSSALWKNFPFHLKNNLIEEVRAYRLPSVKIYYKLNQDAIDKYNLSHEPINYESQPIQLPITSIEEMEKLLDYYYDNHHVPLENRVYVLYPQFKEESFGRVLLIGIGCAVYFVVFLQMFSKNSAIKKVLPRNFLNLEPSLHKVIKSNIKFKDVAGIDEIKFEIQEFVNVLNNPNHYKKLGGKPIRGVLLKGPPGTGKTLLAKATAGEAGVNFISVAGSEFLKRFVGAGAKKVRELFSDAREKSPCIIFIDEIDAMAKKRQDNSNTADRELASIVNQLLSEMDGMNSDSNIVVMAATNRPDILDPALLRPGRFDRHVYIPLPDINGRTELFKLYLSKLLLKDNTPDKLSELATKLAVRTTLMSGADIANVCNEAACTAARQKASHVTYEHFDNALERIIMGIQRITVSKSNILSEYEKEVVAYHESGHAVACWFLEYTDKLLKLSIIPRMKSRSYTWTEQVDKHIVPEQEYLDRIAMALAGRASEEIFFDILTTNAQDDLQRVTDLAYDMVKKLGLNKEMGYRNFSNKMISDKTVGMIDSEVRQLIQTQYDRVKQLLLSKKELVEAIAKKLLIQETLNEEELVEILGPRPLSQH